MIFDLRHDTKLPSKLAGALQNLQEGTIDAMRKHASYHEIDLKKLTAAHFSSPLVSTLEEACKLAARISAYLECPVHFEFNDRPLTAWPTVAKAVEAMFHAQGTR